MTLFTWCEHSRQTRTEVGIRKTALFDGPDHEPAMPWTVLREKVEDFRAVGRRAIECSGV